MGKKYRRDYYIQFIELLSPLHVTFFDGFRLRKLAEDWNTLCPCPFRPDSVALSLALRLAARKSGALPPVGGRPAPG